jgi:copper chaperone NosL
MAVSDARFAAQLVVASEEPRFFDDIGCLRDYLKARPPLSHAVAYVADHRTRTWAVASQAVYTRTLSAEAPMASHIIAHSDAVSRDHDHDARGGTPLRPDEVFGPGGLP